MLGAVGSDTQTTGGEVPGADPLHDPFLDLDRIGRVVAMADVVERNRAITRGYHALSEAVTTLLGRTDANWLTFGQWASAEAGRAIRGESIPGPARPFLGREIERAVAGGNAAVFGDVGRPFARFIVAFRDHPSARHDPVEAAAILEALSDTPELRDSDDLRQAFAAYADVLLLGSTSPDLAARRAQRMLVANVSVGAAEQVVADPFVKAAIPGRSIVAVIATAHLGIHLPDASLALDRDVPPPAYLGGAQFPPELVVLDDPDLRGAGCQVRAGSFIRGRQRRAGLGGLPGADGFHLHVPAHLPARSCPVRDAG